ncbi:MAG: hypothetical protein D4R38_02610 [Dehalococcoidia bacterium]|nr:MAG: hypothetical protein D4R38_02610 [Dehalococcoidia bacterium]
MPQDKDGGQRAAALAGDARAIKHLKDEVKAGKNWYTALLETINMWRSPEEEHNGERYLYLVGGQAFDWLRLAERLCDEINEAIPEDELINLLFFDRPPIEIGEPEFKLALGPAKYRAYLNYLYGVLIEQALLLATIYEVRKASIMPLSPEEEAARAYRRIYQAELPDLLNAFQKEMKYPHRKSLTLTELKEFTYWLFRYRVKTSEKPRVASDTKKALLLMYRRMSGRSV